MSISRVLISILVLRHKIELVRITMLWSTWHLWFKLISSIYYSHASMIWWQPVWVHWARKKVAVQCWLCQNIFLFFLLKKHHHGFQQNPNQTIVYCALHMKCYLINYLLNFTDRYRPWLTHIVHQPTNQTILFYPIPLLFAHNWNKFYRQSDSHFFAASF